MRGPTKGRCVAGATVLVLVLTQFAAGGATALDDNETASDASPPAMTQYGCRSYYSGHVVPVAWARERLPSGYHPRLLPNAWMPAATGGIGAFLMVKTWSCARTVIDGDDAVPGSTYLYYLSVTPPAAARSAGTTAYWLPLEVIATSADEAAVYQAWGLHGSVLGTVRIDETTLPAGNLVEASAESAANRFQTTLPFGSDGGPQPGFRVRYFAYDGVAVTGSVDIVVAPYQGSGYASLLRFDGDDDPWGRPSVGTSSAQLWADPDLSYTWSFQSL